MTDTMRFEVLRKDDVYTANGINVPIVTEGNTLQELMVNIEDAIKLFLKE